MSISKSKALELIEVKINQFNDILNNANYNNIHGQEYTEVYYDAESLICELFSKDDAIEFRENAVLAPGSSDSQKLQNYKKHLGICISQLKAYENKIQYFRDGGAVDDVSLSNSKRQILWRSIVISWKAIVFGLALIVLVSDAINGWPTVSKLINSTLT